MLERNVNIDNATVLVTGAAGFIGSNLVKRLIQCNKNVNIVGVDSVNDYYDVSIKEFRLKEIEELVSKDTNGNKWTFVKANIADKSYMDKLFLSTNLML